MHINEIVPISPISSIRIRNSLNIPLRKYIGSQELILASIESRNTPKNVKTKKNIKLFFMNFLTSKDLLFKPGNEIIKITTKTKSQFIHSAISWPLTIFCGIDLLKPYENFSF